MLNERSGQAAALDPGIVSTSWQHFQDLVADARAEPEGSERRIALLTSALRLYGEGVLTRSPSNEWVEDYTGFGASVRESTELRARDAAERLAQSLLEAERYEAAARLFEHLVEYDLTRCDLERELVRALTLMRSPRRLLDVRKSLSRMREVEFGSLQTDPDTEAAYRDALTALRTPLERANPPL